MASTEPERSAARTSATRDDARREERSSGAPHGPCPPGALTPKDADAALREILDQARAAPLARPGQDVEPAEAIPTFGDAVEAWLTYLRVEKRRKRSTLEDANYVAERHLLPRSVATRRSTGWSATRLCSLKVLASAWSSASSAGIRSLPATSTTSVAICSAGRSPRAVQKVLVLLHGVFKLAKRRGLIESNPSADAERVTLEDTGTFNVLEPVEFEAV